MRTMQWKARVLDSNGLQRRARLLSGRSPEDVVQQDTFFRVPKGQLRMRISSTGAGLLWSRRSLGPGPQSCDCTHAPVAAPGPVLEVLAAALGVAGVVAERRRVYRVGAARVCLDEVERLGLFVEMEVLVWAGDAGDAAGGELDRLRHALGVRREDAVLGAYFDLLFAAHTPGEALCAGAPETPISEDSLLDRWVRCLEGLDRPKSWDRRCRESALIHREMTPVREMLHAPQGARLG